jgi:hypothetical protein
MSAFILVSALLAQVITSQPPALTTQQAIETFDKTCPGKKSPACDQLRWQLEYALYEDLVLLSHTTGKLDDEMLSIGAAADAPQLKAFCLERIRDRGLKIPEHPLVIKALNDPYPVVRQVAQRMAGQLPDKKFSRMLARKTDAGDSSGVLGLLGGVVPDAKTLGAAQYPGATYWYFASDRESDFFTTSDAPEKVLAFYAKGGKKALTLAELEAKIEAARKAPDENPMAAARMMQEAMAKGEDPTKVMERLTKGGGDAKADWGKNIEKEDGVLNPGVSNPRYVILAENPFFGMPVPSSVVAVFKDDLMGATSFVFRRLPPQPVAPPMANQKDIDAMIRRRQVLDSPDAQVPPR